MKKFIETSNHGMVFALICAYAESTVLYSVEHDTWKVADFGLTAEGTSKRALETQYSRGTPSYRAPELIVDGKYTNKVDIWALGCIFYEIIFQKRAFSGDIEIHQYALTYNTSSVDSKIPPDVAEILPRKDVRTFVLAIIRDTLDADSTKRPSAVVLSKRFNDFYNFAECPLRPFFSKEEFWLNHEKIIHVEDGM